MTDDLVERVARALAAENERVDKVERYWKLYEPDARAAIRVVVEECAETVRKHRFTHGTSATLEKLESAIRALAKE